MSCQFAERCVHGVLFFSEPVVLQAHGEEAVLEEFPNSVIVRPTAMFGNYDSFTVPMKKWLRTTNFPFSGTSLFLMEGSEYVETQPVWVCQPVYWRRQCEAAVYPAKF